MKHRIFCGARAIIAMAPLYLFSPSAALAQEAPEPAAPIANTVPVDAVVAVVNDDIITHHELDIAIANVVAQLKQQRTEVPPSDVLERQVLERVIMNRVQLQYAKETGLEVDDATLEKTIARVAESNQLTVPQLHQALAKDGVQFESFREDIRNEIVVARLREREVDNKIVISDGEVDNFLRTQQNGGKAEEFNLSHILIRVSEQASNEEVQVKRARADEALAQIRGGADFKKVAASFSDAPDATQGGVIGWREPSRLPALLAEAVAPLQPGEITGVLRSPNGFHILRLNDRRGQDAPTLVQQTHARHILIKTNEVVSEQEAHARLDKVKERLDSGADFAEMARLQSEDMSAAKGGDLGWLSPGDTVPEFDKAMEALKPGEVSPPVQTQFGWHLIQVIERRSTDMSKEQQRGRARMTLKAQRADDAYQDWLRQLRDKAFVEIKLDEK